MNNETNTPASYGEPWEKPDRDVDDYGNVRWLTGEYGSFRDEAEALRATECWNACKGIADPVEALRVVMETLRGIANSKPSDWDDPTDFEAWAKSRARYTLAKLNNTAP